MGDVFAGISVAAGSSLHQKALFIGQLHRQTVQLEHQHDHLFSRKTQQFRTALRFIQGQQRDLMRRFLQGADSGITANGLCGGVGQIKSRFLFQYAQFIKKRIIFGIRQRRRVEIVVFIPAAIQPVGQFPYLLLFTLFHSLHQPFLRECSEIQFIDHLFDPRIIVPYGLHRRTVFRLYRDQTVPELQQQLRALGANNREVSQLFHFHMTPFIQQYRFPSTIPAVPQS